MSATSFDDLVQSSVREAMSRMLGSEVWEAISFYFDLKTLTREPGVFEKLMNSLFRDYSKALKQSIAETLFSKIGAGTEEVQGRELKEWIGIARARFMSSANFMIPKR